MGLPILRLSVLELSTQMRNNDYDILFRSTIEELKRYQVIRIGYTFYLKITLQNGYTLFLTLFQSNNLFETKKDFYLQEVSENKVHIHFQKKTIELDVDLFITEHFVHWTINILPKTALLYEHPIREICILNEDYSIPEIPKYQLEQIEGRTATCFVGFGHNKGGSLSYIHDIGALSAIAEQLQASLMDTVKITWPQLGFQFPLPLEKNLSPGEEYTIQKAWLLFNPTPITNTFELANQLLIHLRQVYPNLNKPAIKVFPYPHYLVKSLKDLTQQAGCWKQIGRYQYLNAYNNDYYTPAESMVQLAVLEPACQLQRTFKHPLLTDLITKLVGNIKTFFHADLACYVRWLPTEEHTLDYSEEHKLPYIMDTWYLHYTLLKIACLLESNDEDQELASQFFSSLTYLINVAHHFAYKWPIFFHLYSLRIIKEESIPGDYGEKDVAGLYASIMLKAYKKSQNIVYLNEAEYALETIDTEDLQFLYQANNTAYTAEALIELHEMTGSVHALEKFHLCISHLIRNCGLWQMDYGNGKDRPTFFRLYPMPRVPYAAPFEEQETLASFHRILRFAYLKHIPISSICHYFMSEYIQFACSRLMYYYPPMLPIDTLAGSSKTGQLNPALWIPLEDLGDGWRALGQVGQEVYGSATLINLTYYHTVFMEDQSTIYITCSLPFIELSKNSQSIKCLGTSDQSGILWVSSEAKKTFDIYINTTIVQLEKDCILHIAGNDTISYKRKSIL